VSGRFNVRAGLIVGLGALALVAIAVLRPAGPRHADLGEHLQRTEPLPAILPGEPLRQDFVARANGLSQVSVRFGTYGGATRCSVRVTISRRGTVVARRVIPCRDIPDSVPSVAARFPPEPDSRGHGYTLDVEAVGRGDQAITSWGGPPNGRMLPAESGGDELDLTVDLQTGYGDDGVAVDQLDTVLRRVGQYGPFWDDPPFVVLLVLAGCGLLALVAAAPRRLGIALLVAFAVVKGILWSVVLPPLEGVDEAAHFSYSQFLAEQHRIPRRGVNQFDDANGYSPELEAAIVLVHQTSSVPGDRPDFASGSDAGARHTLSELSKRSGGNGAAAGYSPAYYLPAAVLYAITPGSFFDRIASMRLWSVALGALTVWVTVLIGERLFPRSRWAPMALGVAIAAQPMLSQQFAIVNNDALVIALGAVALLLSLDLLEPKVPASRLVGAGLAAGGAVVAKPFGIVFVPLVAGAALVGWIRGRRTETRSWWRDGARLTAGVVLTYGAWWLTAALFRFPAPSLQANDPSPGDKGLRAFFAVVRLGDFKHLRDTWVDQFWGVFSWVDLPFPHWTHRLLLLFMVGLVLASACWLVRIAVDAVRLRHGDGWLAGARDRGETVLRALVCAAAIAGTIGLLYLVAFMQFRLTGRNDLIQGRYALMVAPAVLAFPALVLRRFVPRLDPAVPLVALAGLMVALNVLGLGLLVDRFYI